MAVTAMKVIPVIRRHPSSTEKIRLQIMLSLLFLMVFLFSPVAGRDVGYHDDVLKQLKQEPIVFNDPFHGLSASMDLDFMEPLEGKKLRLVHFPLYRLH